MGGWTKKTDNAHTGAKLEIRRHVLAALAPTPVTVFDAFAGSGQMHAGIWHQAARYVGCDELWHNDDRECYAADNRRVLRCIDLTPFNLFDLDAYGSPWEQVLIIAARRPALTPGERIGLVLTDGTWSNYRSGVIPAALKAASGMHEVRPLGKTQAQATAAAKQAVVETRKKRFDDLLSRALHRCVDRMHGRVAREWRAVAQGGKVSGVYMRYIGAVIEGVK